MEEFIRGHEVTCVVIEGGKGEELYTLLPQVVGDHNLRSEDKREVERLSREAHDLLGLRHYSSSDFVITPKGKIYILETNALPKFHEDSTLLRSLKMTGWHSKDFVNHVLGKT